LQTVACLSLYKEGFIEPVHISSKPYDILLHQILAYVKQLSGTTMQTLQKRILDNYAFLEIEPLEVNQIVDALLKNEMLELIGGELIIGIDGERIVNNKDFYSVFKTEPNYKVINYDKTIGEIPLSFQLQEDQNILLAARIWKIVEVDHDAKKIAVVPATDGKKPIFSGAGADLHFKIRERMLQVLLETGNVLELNDTASEVLRQFREEFKNYPIESLEDDRPVLVKDNNIRWFTFQGTKLNRTLDFMFGLAGIEHDYHEHDSSFTIKGSLTELRNSLARVIGLMDDADFHLENAVRANPALIDFSKWGIYLPLKYQLMVLKSKFFDFAGVRRFLENLNLVEYLHDTNPVNPEKS
jgi:ATP-dependent Lhr-like helicase